MKRLTLFILLLCMAGCAQQEPMQRVRIVHVATDEETGEPDQYTVVEFPDGHREIWWRHWGQVGDEFMARPGSMRRSD